MSSLTPSGGRPDHEEPNYPHGAVIATAANVSVNGTTILAGVNVESIGAYRSLVVQVKNNGTRDIVVTPEWDFYNGAAHIRSTDAQSVPAGTSKRLLFQNQGDLLNKITVTGGGAGDTINHYVAGSNLDPFSGGIRDILTMIQRSPAQAIPTGAGTLLEFGHTAGTTFYTNAAQDWSFDTTGAGDITRVHLLVPGLFAVRVRVKLADLGNYNKQLDLLANSLEPNPPLTQTNTDTSFDTFATDLETAYFFAISPTSTGAANNALSAQVTQASGGNVGVDAAIFQVVRLGSVFP